MFKRIQIDLAEPFCQCEQQDLSWHLFATVKNGFAAVGGLRIDCRICKVRLEVPYNTMQAVIKLGTPYPEGVAEKEVELPDGSKVDSDKFIQSLENQMSKEE